MTAITKYIAQNSTSTALSYVGSNPSTNVDFERSLWNNALMPFSCVVKINDAMSLYWHGGHEYRMNAGNGFESVLDWSDCAAVGGVSAQLPAEWGCSSLCRTRTQAWLGFHLQLPENAPGIQNATVAHINATIQTSSTRRCLCGAMCERRKCDILTLMAQKAAPRRPPTTPIKMKIGSSESLLHHVRHVSVSRRGLGHLGRRNRS
jgi:hypothetical protein